jgi:hypothetical protein
VWKIRWKTSGAGAMAALLRVPAVWLGEQTEIQRSIQEHMSQLDGIPSDALDSRLDQLEIRMMAETDFVEALGFPARHIAGCWTACGISILVVGHQRSPILVARAFDRASYGFPRQCHQR